MREAVPRAAHVIPAIDTIFREQARFVAWVALRILGRDEDIDDVVQEVFVSAIRGLRGLDDPTAVRAWLKTVTVRTAQRRLQKRRLKRFFGLDDTPDALNIVSPEASPEHRALLARVYAILDRIPARERVAWTLRFVDGETLPEVAKTCACSLATAKRRIAAAQAQIDKELSG